MNTKIAAFVESYVACSRTHEPNKETQKVLKNIEQRKNLVKAKDLDDLFAKLEA